MNENNTCLVLGANGFVGSHLVDMLAKKSGNEVRAFDRYSKPPQFNNNENIIKIVGDIYNDNDLEVAMVGVDYIFHAFSATTPFSSDDDPYTDVTKNLLRNVQIFNMCAKYSVKKIIYISTGGAVYGMATEFNKVSEETAALPVSPYGICKLATENYLEYYKRRFQTEYIVYRLTNPYGPRQIVKHNQGVIPAFIEKVREDKVIEVYGDGSSSRNFIFINDAIDMIKNSFEQSNKYPLYNIGSEESQSLNQLITELKKITGKDIRVHYNPSPTTFLHKTEISIDRYCSEFGKPVFTDFRKGLTITLNSI